MVPTLVCATPPARPGALGQLTTKISREREPTVLFVRIHLQTPSEVQPDNRLHGVTDDGCQRLPVFDRERRDVRGLSERGEAIDDARGVVERTDLTLIPGVRLHVDGTERSDRLDAIRAKRHARVGADAKIARGAVLPEQGMTLHVRDDQLVIARHDPLAE